MYGQCQMWKVIEKDVSLIETEEAIELIRRCDLSINKTRCYIEASEQGMAMLHRDII